MRVHGIKGYGVTPVAGKSLQDDMLGNRGNRKQQKTKETDGAVSFRDTLKVEIDKRR